ncbi:MAG: hypothetical protein QME66_10110 [Candidatus Eisenbacteria bacterium]|nr:hypothetical protein [Candidatus Eisenbacteria bacterium]
MIKKTCYCLAVLAVGFLLTRPVFSEPLTSMGYALYHCENGTWVRYTSSEPMPQGGNVPGTNLWRYNYRIRNLGFPTKISTAYVYFNSDDVLRSTWSASCAPTCWTAAKTGPAPGYNNWKIRFRTLTSSCYIAMGDSLGAIDMNGGPCVPTYCSGHFAVEFTWTGASLPGPQNYDLISGAGSETGVTAEVPAPPTALDARSWGRVKALYK